MSLVFTLSGGKTRQAGATQRGFHADITACAALRSGEGFSHPPPHPPSLTEFFFSQDFRSCTGDIVGKVGQQQLLPCNPLRSAVWFDEVAWKSVVLTFCDPAARFRLILQNENATFA